MAFKRKALGVLTRAELLEVGRSLGLEVSTGMRLDELVDVVAGSKKARLDRVLAAMGSRDTLKSICFAVGISADGREKEVLRERILAKARGEDSEEDEPAPRKVPRDTPKREESDSSVEAVPTGKGLGKVAPAVTTGPQQDLPWQAFPVLERSVPSPATTTPPASAPRPTNGAGTTST